MKTLEFKTPIPQGCEIDKENSTFENIIFKEIEKKLPMSFSELGLLDGYYFSTAYQKIQKAIKALAHKGNANVWKSEELAKASLALNQLIWLRDEWNDGWVADWINENETKYCVVFIIDVMNVEIFRNYKRVLCFAELETAQKFANQFESLINEAKPLL